MQNKPHKEGMTKLHELRRFLKPASLEKQMVEEILKLLEEGERVREAGLQS